VPPKDTLWMNLTTFHPFQPLNKLYFTTKKNVFLYSSLWCIWMFILIWGLCTIVWFYFLTRHVAMKGSQSIGFHHVCQIMAMQIVYLVTSC
jgi:hypothetical protein